MKKIFLVSTIFFLFLIIFANQVRAQITPFGGKIVYTDTCNCSGNNKLILYVPVKSFMPLSLSYRSGISTLYEYKNLNVGQEILGITISPDVCLIYSGDSCITHPAVIGGRPWLIKLVGTSGGSSSGSDSGTTSTTPTTPTSPVVSTQTGDDTACSSNADTQASSYIIANEGWRNSCYNDGKGNRTIGVGHKVTVGDSVSCGLPISDDQVQSIFDKDYAQARADAEASARRHGVNWDSLSTERQTVLTDMAFNMGAKGGKGLDGFNNMWTDIKQAQSAGSSPMAQTYWKMAGNEVVNSQYGHDITATRANRNAYVMGSNDGSTITRQINGDSHARQNCKNS